MATDFFSDCIKGYDFGGTSSENVIMTPLNDDCYNACVTECKAFSRRDQNGVELNSEAMVNCMPACQGGTVFSSTYYEYDTATSTVKLKPAVSIGLSCIGLMAARENIYEVTSFQATAGMEMLVSIVSGAMNKVWMCGQKSTYLNPIISSLQPSVWDNTIAPPTVSQDQNQCSIDTPSADWSILSNKKFETTTWIPSRNNWSDRCYWNARNRNYTNTGIPAKDGDQISIFWTSTYQPYTSGLIDGVGNNIGSTSKDLYNLSQTGTSQQRSTVSAILSRRGMLQVRNPGDSYNSTGYILLNGEGARIAYPGDVPDPADYDPANAPAGATWYGLKGTVIDLYNVIQEDTTSGSCNTEDLRNQNYAACHTLLDPGTPFYEFAGNLEGFATNPTDFSLRHFDTFGSSDYEDNVGGTFPTVTWYGCPHENGENLQYYIGSTTPDSSSAWIDFTTNQLLNGESIVVPTDGTIYLRIKPDTVPITSDSTQDITDYYTNPANRGGSYYVMLAQANQTSSLIEDGPIGKIVNAVRRIMFGTDTETGVVERLYKALIVELPFVAMVRAIMILYVVFTGIGYIIGVVQMDRNDMLKRLLKLSIVATVISPTSWEFFSVHFYKLFIDGGIELIAKIISGSMAVGVFDASTVDSNPAVIFAVFDGPFTILFSSETWTKIGVMALSGITGFVFAMVVIFAIVYYAIALGKTVLMFLMATVVIGLLLFMAPLFISFFLFRMTYQYFDTWVKFLISFTLQPVLLFTSIIIFNFLLLITIYTTLGYTVCEFCYLSFSILTESWCLIDFYSWVNNTFTPEGTSFDLPTGAMGAITMIILSKSMLIFCDLIVGVCNFIVMGYGQPTVSLASGSTAETQGMTSGAGRSLKSNLGLGQAAVQQRASARGQRRIANEKAKKDAALRKNVGSALRAKEALDAKKK